jgi:hypothetical protein
VATLPAKRESRPLNPKKRSMIVEAQVTISGTRAAVWAAITDVDSASRIISGVESVEILERPATGLVGLKWRETRMLFGKSASADKWITGAVENEYYETRSEEQGFVYSSILSIAEARDGISLCSRHESKPQGIVARLVSVPVGVLFKGVAKKALLQDLRDIKSAVEQGQPGHSRQS